MDVRAVTTRLGLTALQRITVADLAVALSVAVIQVGATAGIASHHHRQQSCWLGSSCVPPRKLDVLAFVLLVLGPLALVERRRRPVAVLALVFATTLAYVAIGYTSGPIFLSLVIAFGTVVVAGYRRLGWLSVLAGWVLFSWLPPAVGHGGAPTVLEALALAAWLLVLLAAAEGLRLRRERAADAQRQREQEAQRSADEERLRIARELHDVLAHNISLINVQSGVALHLLDQQPDQARSALAAINEASADALREMRAVLGVLRRVDEPAPRAPAAGIDRLDALVDRSAAAGLTVDVEVEGEPRALPASVDLAAYRIVQESLTNVARHADSRAATVRLVYRSDGLTVQVDDDGCGGVDAARSNGGNGIIGMRERATALGGELEAGPRPEGGYRVRARLPVRESA
jgi:signal transduction histidine kinase